MFGLRTAVIGVALAFGISTAASATTVTFDLGGGKSDLGAMTQLVDSGITMDVMSSGGNIHRNEKGYGVAGSPASNRMAGSETLSFTFSPSVSLLSSVIFEKGSGTDDIEIRDGMGTLLASFTVTQSTSGFFSASNLGLTGDTFVFQRVGGSGGAAGVRIKSLSVAAVPLPAAATLLLAGLGGLVLVGRRKQRA